MMPILPMTTLELIEVLAYLVGVLAGALIGTALTARQTREEPRGGGGNSTSDNDMRNETQHRPQLRPPCPQSMERENPSRGLRVLEDARVKEGGENGGGRGEGGSKYWMILIVLLAIRMIIMVMKNKVEDGIKGQHFCSS